VLSLPGKSFRLRPKSPKLSPQQFPAFGRAVVSRFHPRRRAIAAETATPDQGKAHRERITAKRTFGTMAAAGTAAYLRSCDLPKLIALWRHELYDESQEGMFHVLAKLHRALRAERSRGLAGHWSYDLNRHLGLLSAYKGELAALRASRRKA